MFFKEYPMIFNDIPPHAGVLPIDFDPMVGGLNEVLNQPKLAVPIDLYPSIGSSNGNDVPNPPQ
jgi:hypothetical protein